MVVRSLLFNIAFWTYIFILGIICLPICLIYRPFSYTVARLWAHGSLWLLKQICGITHQVKGRENIPKDAAIIASKHESAWDTIVLWTLLSKPSYVLKRELIFFPVFGWYLLLLKSIYIDRSTGSSALKRLLKEAKTRAADNHQIVIFPEGTRITPGVSSIFQPGVAAIYNSLSLPVVPVSLNSGNLWGRNSFTKKPGLITIEFLPAIAAGKKGRDFLIELQEKIEKKRAELG